MIQHLIDAFRVLTHAEQVARELAAARRQLLEAQAHKEQIDATVDYLMRRIKRLSNEAT